MEVMLDPTSQTIHYSSAGRAGVLAQLLAPDPQLAVSIGAWADRLVSTAASLDIGLNTRDVRSLLSAPIEDLEDVVAKSRPVQLRGYGAIDAMVSQVLDQWCASAGACLATLVCVVQRTSAPPVTCIRSNQSFPEMLRLSRHQRNALGAYLQVADDTSIVLERLLQLARAPYPALFSSSLTDHDLACCQAACTNLVVLFEQGRRWIANQPLDRRRVMVQEHLNNAYTALILLFEGTHDRQRRLAVAGLLIELANLKRRM